jgi:glycosyltransferase involved in cell wall biosynthesis
MKVVICWPTISGYTAAFWRALAGRGIDLHVVAGEGIAEAPFSAAALGSVSATILPMAKLNDIDAVGSIVAGHAPQVVVVCGWYVPGFRALLFDRRLDGCAKVMAIDTPLQHTWRQFFGRLALRRLLGRIDRLVVAGERSFALGRYYGVPAENIRHGTYGIDHGLFSAVHGQRSAGGGWPPRFLFLGRYVPDKDIATLMKGYSIYRHERSDAWPLTCCGTGPLVSLLAGAEGVTDRGFVQPPDLPGVMLEHSTLVLPSRFEPWGQVIVEAAAAGMAVIASTACGASVEMVRPYFNGLLTAPGSAESLASALKWVHDHAPLLPSFGRLGTVLASAYSAESLADRWEAMLRELVP